jgi:hypothetical protein
VNLARFYRILMGNVVPWVKSDRDEVLKRVCRSIVPMDFAQRMADSIAAGAKRQLCSLTTTESRAYGKRRSAA